MKNVLQTLPGGARVAVVRLRSLGDSVLSTPALEILKRARPDLKIAVVVEDRFAPIYEGNPDVDAVLAPSIRAVSSWRPQLCLNLHGGTRSAILTALSGARIRAGFAFFRYSFLYHVRIPRAQEILGVERTVHTAEHLASAVFYLGAARMEIPRARLFASPAPPPGRPYAVIHPVASRPDKTWPASRFLAVARHLKEPGGMEPVFIAGPGEDLGAFSEFRTVPGASLSEVKTLLAGATLFLGNDSGPAHMAAAFGLPVLVIYGASDPVVWAPWKTESQVLVGEGSIESIQVDDALAALGRLRVAA
jgi:ADP-heptose:LPS heptosyltransferase